MKNQVLVVENSKTGNVITMKTIKDSKTGESREVGSVMVQSKAPTGLSRIGRLSVRTAFVTLEQDLLEYFEGDLNSGEPFPMQGKIVINETLKPYIFKSGPKKGQPQDAKTKGKGGAVIKHNGKPVYRNSFFSTNMDEQDILLASDQDADVTSSTVTE
jgi:hypothetical protein